MRALTDLFSFPYAIPSSGMADRTKRSSSLRLSTSTSTFGASSSVFTVSSSGSGPILFSRDSILFSRDAMVSSFSFILFSMSERAISYSSLSLTMDFSRASILPSLSPSSEEILLFRVSLRFFSMRTMRSACDESPDTAEESIMSILDRRSSIISTLSSRFVVLSTVYSWLFSFIMALKFFGLYDGTNSTRAFKSASYVS